MEEQNTQPKEGRGPKPSPFRPGTAAWGLWLAGQAHVGRWLSPTVARKCGEIATNTNKIVSPDWWKENQEKS